jgi:sarcosine oxidase subunit alpha
VNPGSVDFSINGEPARVTEGTSVAAAMVMMGAPCRRSEKGEPRAPLCGMGICMECRVTIDGVSHRRGCQTLCRPGMKVETE